MTTREALEYIQEKTHIAFTMEDIRRWIDPLRGHDTGEKIFLLSARKASNGRWFIKKEWVDEFLEEVGYVRE